MTAAHIRPGGGLLTDVHTTEIVPVGTQWTDYTNGKRYVFCINEGADDTAVGDCCGAFLTTPAYANISATAATTLVCTVNSVTITPVAAIALAVVSEDEYAWFQTGGHCTAVLTDGSVAIENMVVCADNATVASTGDETMFHGWFGLVTATDSGTTGNVFLNGCIFDF